MKKSITLGPGLFTLQEMTLNGKAQLALHRNSMDTFEQAVEVRKSLGDKSVLFHVGPDQTLFVDFKPENPLMLFGAYIYNGGILRAEGALTVNDIKIELEGRLDDIEELTIGPNGKVILR